MQINANWLLPFYKGIQKHKAPKNITSLLQAHSKQADNSLQWMHHLYTTASYLWKRTGLPKGSIVSIQETINARQIPLVKKGCCKPFTDVCSSCKYILQILQAYGWSCHLVTLCHELEDVSKYLVNSVSKGRKRVKVSQNLKQSISVK